MHDNGKRPRKDPARPIRIDARMRITRRLQQTDSNRICRRNIYEP